MESHLFRSFATLIGLGILAAVIAVTISYMRQKMAGGRLSTVDDDGELQTRIVQLLAQANQTRDDLHDGPAQLLALALMRLDELKSVMESEAEKAQLILARSTISDALREIRLIISGSRLPELESLQIGDALLLAAELHQQRTGTMVNVHIGELPAASQSIVTTLFRFAQEGLNNAFNHADGKGQALTAQFDGKHIVVEVEDSGLAFDHNCTPMSASEAYGLAAMGRRIKMNDGELQVFPSQGSGTRLVAKFAVAAHDNNQAQRHLIAASTSGELTHEKTAFPT